MPVEGAGLAESAGVGRAWGGALRPARGGELGPERGGEAHPQVTASGISSCPQAPRNRVRHPEGVGPEKAPRGSYSRAKLSLVGKQEWASLVAQALKNLPAVQTRFSIHGRSPGEGDGSPLQHSSPENPMDRGAWRTTVQRSHSQT